MGTSTELQPPALEPSGGPDHSASQSLTYSVCLAVCWLSAGCQVSLLPARPNLHELEKRKERAKLPVWVTRPHLPQRERCARTTPHNTVQCFPQRYCHRSDSSSKGPHQQRGLELSSLSWTLSNSGITRPASPTSSSTGSKALNLCLPPSTRHFATNSIAPHVDTCHSYHNTLRG